MKMTLSLLISDYLIWGLFLVTLVAILYMRRYPHLREPWQQVMRHSLGVSAFVVLCCFASIGLLDSIHVTVSYPHERYVTPQTKSVLDLMMSPLGSHDEKTYSAPFALHLYGKEAGLYPRLRYAGGMITHRAERNRDIIRRVWSASAVALLSFLGLLGLLILYLSRQHNERFYAYACRMYRRQTRVAWPAVCSTFFLLWWLFILAWSLSAHYHIFGTDKVGKDVFYEVVKSIRTGLLIGTLTTMFMLPFALLLGMLAGYFRGWVDDVIQYLYTTLSSIPGVLLISAAILVMQVYISHHPALFPTLMARADARLLALCFILGLTGWAGLCRLLRAETLKLRQLEYIQAARALGVKRMMILLRHIMPNVMHIVLITVVLDFSGLVLAEAVLSYVGVGVDPTTYSWGNIINSSRLELAREPVVWWPLLAALLFMFVLVLAANLFSDAVRDALDPRTH
jgi:peptide/nickel transport system permease protein